MNRIRAGIRAFWFERFNKHRWQTLQPKPRIWLYFDGEWFYTTALKKRWKDGQIERQWNSTARQEQQIGCASECVGLCIREAETHLSQAHQLITTATWFSAILQPSGSQKWQHHWLRSQGSREPWRSLPTWKDCHNSSLSSNRSRRMHCSSLPPFNTITHCSDCAVREWAEWCYTGKRGMWSQGFWQTAFTVRSAHLRSLGNPAETNEAARWISPIHLGLCALWCLSSCDHCNNLDNTCS